MKCNQKVSDVLVPESGKMLTSDEKALIDEF